MSPQLLKKISVTEKQIKDAIKRAQREVFVIETLTSMHEMQTGKVKKFKSADAAFSSLVK